VQSSAVMASLCVSLCCRSCDWLPCILLGPGAVLAHVLVVVDVMAQASAEDRSLCNVVSD
jgi:hypothetical protein